jgi:Cytochrome P460
MRRFGSYLVGIAMAGVALVPSSAPSPAEASSIFITKIPAGYRDWKLISVAHEEANLNSFAAVLGNDVAIKAYRDGKLPFPDGTIIAALHYRFVPSEENNKAFGQTQSFVAGDPTNVQFMVKDTKRYASTGGWGRDLQADRAMREPSGKAGGVRERRRTRPARRGTGQEDRALTGCRPRRGFPRGDRSSPYFGSRSPELIPRSD